MFGQHAVNLVHDGLGRLLVELGVYYFAGGFVAGFLALTVLTEIPHELLGELRQLSHSVHRQSRDSCCIPSHLTGKVVAEHHPNEGLLG